VDAVVTSPYFQVPTTVAAFGGRLVAVNAKYDTGFSADSGDVRGRDGEKAVIEANNGVKRQKPISSRLDGI
jgi:hypothetical protein